MLRMIKQNIFECMPHFAWLFDRVKEIAFRKNFALVLKELSERPSDRRDQTLHSLLQSFVGSRLANQMDMI